MSSSTSLLHVFLTCFKRNVSLKTKNLLLEFLKSGSGCLPSIIASLGDLSQGDPSKHSPLSGESVLPPFRDFSALETPFFFFLPLPQKNGDFSVNFTGAESSCLPSQGWGKEEDFYLLLAAGQGAPRRKQDPAVWRQLFWAGFRLACRAGVAAGWPDLLPSHWLSLGAEHAFSCWFLLAILIAAGYNGDKSGRKPATLGND